MIRWKSSNILKWKSRLISNLEKAPIHEREVIIQTPKYTDKDFVVTYYSSDAYLSFKIFHFSKGLSKLTAIHHGEKITISDIECIKNDKGYGSILLSELIEFAISKNIDYIDGWLSRSDVEDHKDRLFRFYQKFGFSITKDCSANDNRLYNIKLKL